MKIIEHAHFGMDGKSIEPTWSCLSNPDKNLMKYFDCVLEQPFDKKRFRRNGVVRNIGSIEDFGQFSEFNNIRCLDMPIKLAGEKDYKIPKVFEQFLPVISDMISFEAGHNLNINDYYAYLTVDQTRREMQQFTHREEGLHVDGFQGARIDPKVKCDRSYIIVDGDAPSIWNQAFESVESMDDATQNIFHEFDRTKHYSSEIKCIPYNIYFMDCYAVHSANRAHRYERTFCRLSFSIRRYDRLGNSHNHLLDYKWEMFKRDIASVLKTN